MEGKTIKLISILYHHRGISFIVAAAAGSLLTFSFAPFFWWPLGLFSLALLYGGIYQAASIQHALTLSGAFGLGTFGTGASWIYIALPKTVGIYVISPSISTLIFVTYLAFFIAIAGGITRWLFKNPIPSWCCSAIFASAWVLGEWLRGGLFGGFTSQAIGYSQIDGPLAGFAPITGIYGISWLTVFVSGLVFHIVRESKNRLPHLLATVAIFLSAWGLSFVDWTQPFGETVSVRLLQPNIDPGIKFLPEKIPATLEQYYSLITKKPADLIITPETAMPMYWHNLPPNYIEGLSHFSEVTNSNILLGIESIQDGERATNNVVGLLADGHNSFPRYEKVHLMPFGEYIPIGFEWFSNPKDITQGSLVPGSWSQSVMTAAGQHLGFMICHEAMFGEDVIRWIPDATILVNPGNLAWFVNSLASAQMLQIIRMRAAETGRPILSAPNSGITAIIDPHGKIVASLPPSVSAVLEGRVQGRQGRTPYSIWGNYPVLFILLLVFCFAIFQRLVKREAAYK